MDRDFYLTRKVDLPPPPTRWYQFTLRRIFAATTAMALWCGDLVLLRGDHAELDSWTSSGLLLLSVFAYFALGPFLAVGILVGHPFKAVGIGVLVMLLVVGAMLLNHFSPC
jgi:hypothetical protein